MITTTAHERAHPRPAATTRSDGPWPISEHALRELMACLERADRPDGLDRRRHGSARDRAQRLRRQLGTIAIASDPETAAIGRRVTVATQERVIGSWWLALPGDEAATADTVSITSPIGRALAWASIGETVYLIGDLEGWGVVLEVAGPR
jgi:transcription elongation GreA/GreB family factor